MENKNIEKIYFVPGNLVIIKHDLDNKPIMLVTEVVTSKIGISFPTVAYYGGWSDPSQSSKPINTFKGIKCGWFDTRQVWREQIFSTKDLIKVEEGE